jgi:hypothetical protein
MRFASSCGIYPALTRIGAGHGPRHHIVRRDGGRLGCPIKHDLLAVFRLAAAAAVRFRFHDRNGVLFRNFFGFAVRRVHNLDRGLLGNIHRLQQVEKTTAAKQAICLFLVDAMVAVGFDYHWVAL